LSTGRREPRLVVGLGARVGVPQVELDRAIELALAAAGRPGTQVAVLATLDRRAAEDGVRAVAKQHGWELIGYAAAELAEVAVPGPSRAVRVHTATPSVAEAAALRAAGAGGTLIASKRVFPRVTVAIAARVPA
jgi:cobalamin biosynthesis protein CbiG